MTRWISRTLLACALGLAVGSCGVPVDVTEGYGSGGFPHPEGYSRLHMEDVEEDDTACFECHAEDEDGRIEGTSVYHCSLCHAYPPVHLEDEE